jgi:hypothetical protein
MPGISTTCSATSGIRELATLIETMAVIMVPA